MTLLACALVRGRRAASVAIQRRKGQSPGLKRNSCNANGRRSPIECPFPISRESIANGSANISQQQQQGEKGSVVHIVHDCRLKTGALTGGDANQSLSGGGDSGAGFARGLNLGPQFRYFCPKLGDVVIDPRPTQDFSRPHDVLLFNIPRGRSRTRCGAASAREHSPRLLQE